MTTKMELPSLTPKNVQATLELLANGEVCSCKATVGPPLPLNYDCPRCNGTGRTAPDLRMIDALVCRELGGKPPRNVTTIDFFNDELRWFREGSTNPCFTQDVPAYTTSWAHGGPLLEEVKGKAFYDSIQFPAVGTFKVTINSPNIRDFRNQNIFIHKSELVARVCAWLIWKVQRGK